MTLRAVFVVRDLAIAGMIVFRHIAEQVRHVHDDELDVEVDDYPRLDDLEPAGGTVGESSAREPRWLTIWTLEVVLSPFS